MPKRKKDHPTKPTKFSVEGLTSLKELIGIGITDCNSGILAFKITERTWYEWLSEQSPLSKDEKAQLLVAIDDAHAEFNKRMILIIQKSAQEGDGKLALDLLKRRERKEYGDEKKLTGDPDAPLKVVIEDYGVKNHTTAETKTGA